MTCSPGRSRLGPGQGLAPALMSKFIANLGAPRVTCVRAGYPSRAPLALTNGAPECPHECTRLLVKRVLVAPVILGRLRYTTRACQVDIEHDSCPRGQKQKYTVMHIISTYLQHMDSAGGCRWGGRGGGAGSADDCCFRRPRRICPGSSSGCDPPPPFPFPGACCVCSGTDRTVSRCSCPV